MSTVRPAVRQAARVCSRSFPTPTASRPFIATSASRTLAKRTYVSASKKDNATVNVDTTIKADQKAFLKQTGTNAQDAIMPSTGMSADAMMSPAAGERQNSAS